METQLNPYPLYCLPALGYFEALAKDKNHSMALGEKYEKQSNRNRFMIAGPNGPQLLSIPIIHASSHSAIANVQIDNSTPWNIKHWRSIETAYNKAPFFEFYSHYFEPLFRTQYYLLAEWNLEALKICLRIMKLPLALGISTTSCQTLQNIDNNTTSIYNQVFIEKNGFLPNLSILDLIFNEGPMAKDYF